MKFNKKTKIVLAIILILVIAAIIYFYANKQTPSLSPLDFFTTEYLRCDIPEGIVYTHLPAFSFSRREVLVVDSPLGFDSAQNILYDAPQGRYFLVERNTSISDPVTAFNICTEYEFNYPWDSNYFLIKNKIMGKLTGDCYHTSYDASDSERQKMIEIFNHLDTYCEENARVVQ